jgi:hypothetical protein
MRSRTPSSTGSSRTPVPKAEHAEKLVCGYLAEVRERGADRDFGYSNIYDYTAQRFGFKPRKTRYLLLLGRSPRRFRSLSRTTSGSSLENALEICRRVSGAEISPAEALEYMAAEFIATWGHPREAIEEEEKRPESERPRVMPERDPRVSRAVEDELCSEPVFQKTRKFVLERDHWKCCYPGSQARRELHVHHVELRSQGGGHEPWNCVVLCAFHHGLIHAGHVRVTGTAPFHLVWTPPRLMQDVLERRRNRPSLWVGELEMREWPSQTSA